MKKNIHKILFVSTIVVLVLLLVQTFTNFVYVKPLAGVTVEVEKPKLTLPNYIDGSFKAIWRIIVANTADFGNGLSDCTTSIFGTVFMNLTILL